MDPSDHRLTRIDMLALAGTRSPTKITERAVSYDSLGSTSKNDASCKNRAGSRERALDASTGTGKAPSGTVRSTTSGPLQPGASWQLPWEKYEKIYNVELGSPVELAVRKSPPVELVYHQNIVTAVEAFTTDTGLYIILKYMPLSLEQVVRSPAYPYERQLVAILGQVVTGVAYLAAEGFEHGSLTCSTILLNTDGDVKIAKQEGCHIVSELTGKPCDIRALSSITMELIQKHVKEDGAVDVDNLHRWPSNSDDVGFLSATSSAASAVELLKHPLLSRPYQKGSLIGICL